MKILLIEPPNLKTKKHYHEVSNAPLCSHLFTGYVGSFLSSEGFSVSSINLLESDWKVDRLLDLLPEKLDIIAVNLLYLWERTEEIITLLGLIKGKRSFHLSLFGYYPSFSSEYLLLTYSFVDSVVIGEPEEPFLALVRALKANRGLHNIDGVVTRDNIDSCRFGDVLTSLDDLPFPMRNSSSSETFFYILGSRGCPFSCSFCYVNTIYGKHSAWRGRSIDNILDEIEFLAKEHGAGFFYFADANFLGPSKTALNRVRELSREVKQRRLNFKFGMECRASEVSEEIILLLKEAGLNSIFLGLESASERALLRYNKKINPKKNSDAVDLVKKAGIALSCGWIMFDPHTTLYDLEKNFTFLSEHGLLDCPTNTAHLLSHRVWLFKGTPFFGTYSCGLSERLKMGYEVEWSFINREVQEVYNAFVPLAHSALNSTAGKDLDPLAKEGYAGLNESLKEHFLELIKQHSAVA